MPPNITTADAHITSVKTEANGVITVVPVAINGIGTGDTFILTPTLTAGKVTWSNAGSGCLGTGLCQ